MVEAILGLPWSVFETQLKERRVFFITSHDQGEKFPLDSLRLGTLTGSVYCIFSMHRHLILRGNPKADLIPICKCGKKYTTKLSDFLTVTRLVWHRCRIQTAVILTLHAMPLATILRWILNMLKYKKKNSTGADPTTRTSSIKMESPVPTPHAPAPGLSWLRAGWAVLAVSGQAGPCHCWLPHPTPIVVWVVPKLVGSS